MATEIILATGVVLPGKLVAMRDLLQSEGFTYGLGAKINPLNQEGADIWATSESGQRVKQVDCSGFVRWIIFHATGQNLENLIPDGSVDQHAWCEAQGFPKGEVSDGHLLDGALRIAFLTPESSGEGIGHVMLLYGGETYESHGGKGPDSRDWGSEPFMGLCVVYELCEA